MAWEKVRITRRNASVSSNAIRLARQKSGVMTLVVPKFMANGPRCEMIADRATKQLAFRIGDVGVSKVSTRDTGNDVFIAIPKAAAALFNGMAEGTHEAIVYPGVGEAAGFLVIDVKQFTAPAKPDLFSSAAE